MCPPLDMSARGRLAEGMAAAYLELRGYRIIDRNLRLGPREIDLTAVHDGWAIAVEVRFRSGDTHGRPEETLDPGKRRHLERAGIEWWLSRGRSFGPLRFDLVSILLTDDGLALRHYPHFLRPSRARPSRHGFPRR